MKRLPLVVAVLLVTTVVGVGVAPPSAAITGEQQVDSVDPSPSSVSQLSGSVAADTNVTNTLAIPAREIERSDLRRQYTDLGPAAGFDTGITTERLATRTIERELEGTASDSELGARIVSELDAVEAEVDSLETRERTAIRAFSRGDIAPRELLIELATIHLTATELQNRTNSLESYASTLDEEPISHSRIQRIEYDLRMLTGPLRRAVHP